MIYLTGAYRRSQLARLAALGVGVMLQPGNGYREYSILPCWAADNGCFAKGENFSLPRFYKWLAAVPRDRCLFAVAPDVFPDAAATLRRSLPELAEIRRAGFKAAFVLQDGAESIGVPWDDCDAVFVGATDPWKLGSAARTLVTEARRRGKWVHMGRVNSERRLRYATLIGCQSADGTFLRFRNRANGDGAADLAKWFSQRLLLL